MLNSLSLMTLTTHFKLTNAVVPGMTRQTNQSTKRFVEMRKYDNESPWNRCITIVSVLGRDLESIGDLPALMMYIPASNRRISEWYRHGRLDRHTNDQPARIEVYDTHGGGIIEERKWYRKGHLHRSSDQPAVVQTITNGANGEPRWILKEWYQHGLRHRTNGPAVLNQTEGVWFHHGKLYHHPDPMAHESPHQWAFDVPRLPQVPSFNNEPYLPRMPSCNNSGTGWNGQGQGRVLVPGPEPRSHLWMTPTGFSNTIT